MDHCTIGLYCLFLPIVRWRLTILQRTSNFSKQMNSLFEHNRLILPLFTHCPLETYHSSSNCSNTIGVLWRLNYSKIFSEHIEPLFKPNQPMLMNVSPIFLWRLIFSEQMDQLFQHNRCMLPIFIPLFVGDLSDVQCRKFHVYRDL